MTTDSSFNNNNFGTNGRVYDYGQLPNGNVIIVGSFTEYNNSNRNGIACIDPEGNLLDEDFNGGIDGIESEFAYGHCVEVYDDGSFIVGGRFSNVGGIDRECLVRFNADFSVDSTFDASDVLLEIELGPNDIHDVTIDGDKILIGGVFGTETSDSFARLNYDGSADGSFNGVNVSAAMIRSITPMNDGRILLLGDFVESANLIGILALLEDGSKDPDFSVSIRGSFRDVIFQDDGKMIVGGILSTIEDVSTTYMLCRIFPDGTIDESFEMLETVEMSVPAYLAQSVYDIVPYNGKYLACGLFDSFGGTGISDIALINTDGSVDTTFQKQDRPDHFVMTALPQETGKIIVSTSYQNYNPEAMQYVLRLGPENLNSHDLEALNGVLIYSDNGCVAVEAERDVLEEVNIYDTLGRLLIKAENINFGRVLLPVDKDQILVVNVFFQNGDSGSYKILSQ